MEENQITLENLGKGSDNAAFSSVVSPPFPSRVVQELIGVLQLIVFSRGRRDSVMDVMVHVVKPKRRGEAKGKGDSPPTAGRITPGDASV